MTGPTIGLLFLGIAGVYAVAAERDRWKAIDGSTVRRRVWWQVAAVFGVVGVWLVLRG